MSRILHIKQIYAEHFKIQQMLDITALCRYLEEAGVDDEAEVTVNEIDDQVKCMLTWHADFVLQRLHA